MKKVIILIGSYCSGKTELAMNLAVTASGAGRRTLVVDLDRINDYFRMSDHMDLLTEKHVDIVSPTFAGKGPRAASRSTTSSTSSARPARRRTRF